MIRANAKRLPSHAGRRGAARPRDTVCRPLKASSEDPGVNHSSRSPQYRRAWLLIALLTACLPGGSGLVAQETRPVVYVVPVQGMIDLGLAPFVERILDEAAKASAA